MVADDLRDDFDRSFALAPKVEPAVVTFLRIRAGGQAHAIAMSAIRAMHVDLYVCRVPARVPAMLGVAAIRGAIVPVYDLRVLLGSDTTAPPRWTVVAGASGSAFAFDGFDRVVRVAADHAAAATIRDDGAAIPVLDLGSIRSETHAR